MSETMNKKKCDQKSVRILLVGYKSSGKTAFVKRLYDGDFHQQLQSTYNMGIYKFSNFDQKNVDVVLLDMPGDEEEFLKQIHEVGIINGIICFKTYLTQKVHCMKQVVQMCPDVPIIYVTSFRDQPPYVDFRYVDRNEIELPFYEISSKSCYQLAKPIYEILKQINHS